MASDSKVRRDEFMQKALEADPEIAEGKSLVFRMCILLLASRVLLVAIDAAYVLSKNLSFSTMVINCVSLAVGILFVFSIYKQGAKPLCYLIMAGGVWTIVNSLLSTNFLSGFSASGIFYKIDMVALFITGALQAITMLVIVLSRVSKKYFHALTNATKMSIQQVAENRSEEPPPSL